MSNFESSFPEHEGITEPYPDLVIIANDFMQQAVHESGRYKKQEAADPSIPPTEVLRINSELIDSQPLAEALLTHSGRPSTEGEEIRLFAIPLTNPDIISMIDKYNTNRDEQKQLGENTYYPTDTVYNNNRFFIKHTLPDGQGDIYSAIDSNSISRWTPNDADGHITDIEQQPSRDYAIELMQKIDEWTLTPLTPTK